MSEKLPSYNDSKQAAKRPHSGIQGTRANGFTVKAKFYYASWFEAGSKLGADRFEAKFHYAIWFEAGSKLVEAGSKQVRSRFEAGSKLVGDRLRTSFEPASNQIA